MAPPYSVDLRWRIVWLCLFHHKSKHEIATLLHVSTRPVERYIQLFLSTGDVAQKPKKNGPNSSVVLVWLSEFQFCYSQFCILQNDVVSYSYSYNSDPSEAFSYSFGQLTKIEIALLKRFQFQLTKRKEAKFAIPFWFQLFEWTKHYSQFQFQFLIFQC